MAGAGREYNSDLTLYDLSLRFNTREWRFEEQF